MWDFLGILRDFCGLWRIFGEDFCHEFCGLLGGILVNFWSDLERFFGGLFREIFGGVLVGYCADFYRGFSRILVDFWADFF